MNYLCGKCGGTEYYERHEDGYLSKRCKKCHHKRVARYRRARRTKYAEYQRARRKRTGNKYYSSEWYAKNRDKVSARGAVYRALRDGKLKRMPCENCGASQTQAHHHDYSKKLDIRWLCSACHGLTHSEIG
jgi:hypothetical protein